MFDKDEIAVIKARLLRMQQQLQGLQETVDAASRVVKLDQTSVGRLSRMDAMQGQAMSQEAGRRRQLQLQGISAALRRIETGDYGYCLRCDEPVAPGRLAHDPAASLCIDCANRQEQ